MKKSLATVALVVFLVPSLSFAATTADTTAQYIGALWQLITLLEERITQLQTQVIACQTPGGTGGETITPVVFPPLSTIVPPPPVPTTTTAIDTPLDLTGPVIGASNLGFSTLNGRAQTIRIFTNEPIDVQQTRFYWGEWGPGLSFDVDGNRLCDPIIPCQIYTYFIPATYSAAVENLVVNSNLGKYRTDLTVDASLTTPAGASFLKRSAQLWIFDQAGNHSIIGLGASDGLQ